MNSNQNLNLKLSEEIIYLLLLEGYDEKEIEKTKSIDGQSDELDIKYKIKEMPQFPVYAINEIEEIKIIIKEGDFPMVYCRDDFPIVPHLNVYSNGDKSLCLFDASFNDLKYTFNANMFLRQIDWWFNKTVRNKLHQSDQPLEPFFPNVVDIIIFNIDKLKKNLIHRLVEISNENNIILRDTPLDIIDVGEIYLKLPIKVEKKISNNIINKQPNTLEELNDAFDFDIVGEIDKYIPLIWELRQCNYIYKEIFQQSLRNFEKSKILLIIEISLARECGEICEQTHYKPFVIDTNFKSLYKLFNYSIMKNKMVKKDDNNKLINVKNVKIIQFELMVELSTEFAQMFNNLSKTDSNLKFLQVGVGTLGSQLFNNCVKAGYGQWTILDYDIFLPHNIARHILTASYIGENKADAMSIYANENINGFSKERVNVIKSNFFSKEEKENIAKYIERTDLVIDTSASVSVQRYLCDELAGMTRCVSFFMNPSGKSLIVLMEDYKREITLNELEMQYYSFIYNENEYHNHLNSDQPAYYSVNCRSKSSKILQDNVAIFSGLCSKVIKQTNDKAFITITTIDNLDVNTRYINIDEFIEFNVKGWQVKIKQSVYNIFFEARKEKLPNETGGILIGSFNHFKKICYITNLIPSPNDSKEYPNTYIRGHQDLQKKIETVESITLGNLKYVGEWHSHPTSNMHPSTDDLKLLKYITKYNILYSNPGCMIIVGKNSISVHLEW